MILEILWWIRALLRLTPMNHHKKAVSCPKDLKLQRQGSQRSGLSKQNMGMEGDNKNWQWLLNIITISMGCQTCLWLQYFIGRGKVSGLQMRIWGRKSSWPLVLLCLKGKTSSRAQVFSCEYTQIALLIFLPFVLIPDGTAVQGGH